MNKDEVFGVSEIIGKAIAGHALGWVIKITLN